jgi:peptidoglycan/LPS O-acetylase OafA/YrhL
VFGASWPALAHAQGGHFGEGPGWTQVLLVGALIATAILGTVLTVALVVLNRSRKRLGWAVLAAYLVSAVLVVLAALVGLITKSWWGVGAVVVVGGALFCVIARRR